MKIILEIHHYAPELNKAYVGPTKTRIPAPGCKTIAEVRARLFAPLKTTGRYVVLKATNPPQYRNHDRTRQGFANDMRSLAGALRAMRNYHNLPGCTVAVISSKLIG